jgi:hypothetical protein
MENRFFPPAPFPDLCNPMNLSFLNVGYRPQRIKQYATEPAGSISLQSSDVWAAVLVAGISLLVYSLTVAPSVAAGDHAELQYIPFRLGIPHPNGYPLYIFLGWLWSWLPVGTLAWRMNMLSAVLGAMGVGLTYLLLRVTGLSRKSSTSGSLVWAFQRTFWVYAGLAHRYTLLMLLGLALLFALMLWRQRGELRFFFFAALLAGLGLANHIAAPLFFVPGAILLIWPRQFTLPKVKLFVLAALLVLLPVLLYVYIPLRGAALWSVSHIDESYGVPLAVLQGIIHPRFAPDATTLWQYFIAGTPGSVSEVLTKAGGNSWFVPLLIRDEFGIFWLVMGLSGLLVAFWRNRVWGAALWSLFVVDFMLALYWRQGNVNAYFLPADFAIVVGLAELLNGTQYLVLVLVRRTWLLLLRLFGLDTAESHMRPTIAHWLVVVIAVAGLLMPWAFFLRNWDSADHSADLVTDSYWRTVLALDIEENAGILAHWSDLTPFWYFQQAEDQRPDLKGLYLPDLNQVRADLARGGAVYLAGPLAGWYGDLQQKLRLIPWGPLVKMVLPEEPVPTIEHTGSLIGMTLGGKIELRTVALSTEFDLPAGTTVPLTLTWTTLTPVQRDLHISALVIVSASCPRTRVKSAQNHPISSDGHVRRMFAVWPKR